MNYAPALLREKHNPDCCLEKSIEKVNGLFGHLLMLVSSLEKLYCLLISHTHHSNYYAVMSLDCHMTSHFITTGAD